ncbi:MAG: hypothetical protein PVJ39_16985 [Gammaproteobacteria bacterium]|jgi:hypothetical protein
MLVKQVLVTKRALVVCALPLSLVAASAHAAGAGQGSNAFNPDIGLILNGTYGQFSHDPADYAISGFPLGGESDPGARGFAIGESELNLSANIDPDWYGVFTYAMASDEAGVENAYVQTTSIGHGVTVKFGRFFSGIGYLNEQHAHTWDFADTALAYRALLGTQFGGDGLQLRWLAPTDLFTEVGAEMLNGDAFPAGGSANDGRGAWTAYVHVGDDVGDSNSWRAGLSYLSAKSDSRETGDPGNPDVFTGTSKVMIADFVWKWAPHGNPYKRNFKLQAEFLRSSNDGDFTPAGGGATPYSATPTGWYVQGVYQFKPRWRVALRHDQLNADDPGAAFAGTVLDSQGHDPKRNSVMIDYSNSEFSRLRLQFNSDQSQPETNNEWFLQYTMSLGAHGAHIF